MSYTRGLSSNTWNSNDTAPSRATDENLDCAIVENALVLMTWKLGFRSPYCSTPWLRLQVLWRKMCTWTEVGCWSLVAAFCLSTLPRLAPTWPPPVASPGAQWHISTAEAIRGWLEGLMSEYWWWWWPPMLSGLCEAAEAVTVVTWRPPVTRPDAPPEAVGIKTQVWPLVRQRVIYVCPVIFSKKIYFQKLK